MSISAMKQALEAITNVLAGGDFDNPYADLKQAGAALKQAIAEAENVSVNTPSFEDLTETEDIHAIDMSEKHVQISDKNRLIRIMDTFDLATGHADTMNQALDALEAELRDILGHLRARREWVGLTDEEIKALASWWPSYDQMPALMILARDIENSLKEKNNVLR